MSAPPDALSSAPAPGDAAGPAPQAAPSSLLGVQAGAGCWLLRLEDAGEIIAVPELATVPLTQPWYLGLANVRGNLVSVVDFAAFAANAQGAPGVGGAPAAPGVRTAEARLVLLSERYRSYCALLVHRLLGLKDARKMRREEAQGGDAARREGAWRGARHRDDAGTLWQELDVTALLRDEGFLRAGL